MKNDYSSQQQVLLQWIDSYCARPDVNMPFDGEMSTNLYVLMHIGGGYEGCAFLTHTEAKELKALCGAAETWFTREKGWLVAQQTDPDGFLA